MCINWSQFGAWTISSVTASVLHYCSELSNKIEEVLDVRISFLSLLEYYRESMKAGEMLPMRQSIDKLLFGKAFSDLL